MINEDEKELEFWEWCKEHGEEEAIRIAAEEWGMSVPRVKLLVRKWDELY